MVQYTYVSGVDPVSGWSVDALRNALISLNRGTFTAAGALADDMCTVPIIAKCLGERYNSFTTLPLVVTPTTKRGDGRHCADFIREVWPDIMSPATLRTIHRYFRMMGFCIIGMDWEERSDGGKRYWLPQLKPWQPQLTSYIQMTDPRTVDGGQWCALTMNKGLLHVEPGRGRWALLKGEDIRPWLSGGVRVLGQAFVGWQENFHDNMAWQNRFGRGIMKLFYPRGYNVQEIGQAAQGLAQAGGGGVLPCMTDSDGKPLVNLEMVKADGTGYQTYESTEKRLLNDILLFFLGQNMTSIGQTGGYAQARVHEGILWNKREEDASNFGDARLQARWEQEGNRRRLVKEWIPCDGPWRTQITNWIAYFNYGAFDLAPHVWYDATEQESEKEEMNARAERGAKQASALKALAEPGLVRNLDRAPALAALQPASYALCLSFLDSDTPLWLAPGLDSPTLRANLAFHCGCPIVAEREQALFALLDEGELDDLSGFDSGSDLHVLAHGLAVHRFGVTVQQRQDFARAVGAARGIAPCIFVDDAAVAFVPGGAEDPRLAGLHPAHRETGHQALELRQHVALVLLRPAVLGREVERDGESPVHAGERRLVGGVEAVAPVLADIERQVQHGCRRQQRDQHGDTRHAALEASASRKPRRQDEGGQCREPQPEPRQAQTMGRRQQAALELLEGLGRRNLAQGLEPFRAGGGGEIEHPEAQREGECDDGGGGRRLGERRREEGDARHRQRIERMTEEEIGGLGRREMATRDLPEDERREGHGEAQAPGRAHRGELDRHQRGRRERPLQGELQRAALLVLAQGADGDEGKQQRGAQIEGAQRRHQDAVQRRHAAGHFRELQRRAARLAEQAHRLDKAVAGERRQQEQHGPPGAAGKQAAQLVGEDGRQASELPSRRLRLLCGYAASLASLGTAASRRPAPCGLVSV